MFEKKLRNYADLIIQMGVNVQKDQLLIISISAEQTKFAELLTEAAYAAGAAEVRVEFSLQSITKLHYLHRSEELMSEVTEIDKAKLQEQVERLPAVLYIDSSDPQGLLGVDNAKLQRVRQRRYPIIKPYRDQIENKQQWCIAAAAGADWAKMVFPDKSGDDAVMALWDAIFDACYVDDSEENLALQRWHKHNENFNAHAKWLNERKFDYLHYQNGHGTDFKVWLNPEVRWDGGDEDVPTGVRFNPNMPTEEIFTSPMAGRAEGIVYATKPLSHNGQTIRDFYIRFENGEAVEWDAKEGKDGLDAILGSDEGAKRLGECALVPHESPISQSGLLFYNTLFDENASCHIALGRGFSNLLEGFETMDAEEHKAHGINDSMMHVDFMIGSADLSIDGYTASGEKVAVFRDGNWAFEI